MVGWDSARFITKARPMTFPDLPPTISEALTERGYAEATPVQAQVLEG